ncbi:ABC transporter ATP-binding protein [Xylocopilactobacillus apicola]|uniref:ABC transporter ATP-binding protein n=1 Tax=Xylocopilactobacillus apicola TaxID=2932184 RepID=A0AAU9CZL5_9LACO|nr:ABC transporter ATP-binding protein [Xylocopilactobacillus apicola]BDR57876.1 ABC transporter ATP-binding protein [Xylocopilactobacillus apicola]
MENTNYLVEVNHVSKQIQGHQILKDLSFKVAPGRVMGFLGPNGAGKTTLLRIITGLMHQSDGNVEICGYDTIRDFEKAVFNVGTIIESPEFYNYLTGLENLRIFADMSRKNITNDELKQDLIETGLADAQDKKVKGYSLGMRQRLGVANATLHHPKILILDEPMNGLDPKGMKDFRELMKKFVKQGNSIIISSHILSEIQDIVNDLFIINKGEKIYEGTMSEFLNRSNSIIYVEVADDITRAEEILTRNGYQVTNNLNRLEITVNANETDQRPEIARLLVNNEIALLGLNLSHSSLEDSFLDSITADNEKKGLNS